MDNIIKIYSNPEDLTQGICGQCLTWLLEVLHHLEINNNNAKVIFDINTSNNKNLIPKFIKPKKTYDINTSTNLIEISLKHYKIEKNVDGFMLNTENFEITNKLFNKYFKFNDFVINEVNKLNIDNKTLGIHYRGTDKNYDTIEANFITKEEMILIIQDYIKNNNVEKIFCCSDEASFVNAIERVYPNLVIEYKQIRSTNSNNWGFYNYGEDCCDKKRDNLTNSSLIDMLALSKCNTIIKTSSAFSSFSKILNPSLKMYTVSAMKLPYFPCAVAEQYKSNSQFIKNILKRTMKDDCYNKSNEDLNDSLYLNI